MELLFAYRAPFRLHTITHQLFQGNSADLIRQAPSGSAESFLERLPALLNEFPVQGVERSGGPPLGGSMWTRRPRRVRSAARRRSYERCAARLHAAYIHDETLIAADASRWAETSLHVEAVAGAAAVELNGHPVRIALSASPA